jgi:hypothetical protein
MFTNATVLELYAGARRAEDLLPRRSRTTARREAGLGALLRRLIRPRGTLPAPAPLPVRVQPR